MNELKKIPRKLTDLIFFALDHGVDSIKKGGTLIPFTIVENGKSKGRTLLRFVTELLEDGEKKAKQYLEGLTPSPDYGVVAYDGYVTVKGKKYDAILVLGYSNKEEKGYLFAQRYIKNGDTLIKLFSNPVFLGLKPNLLKKNRD